MLKGNGGGARPAGSGWKTCGLILRPANRILAGGARFHAGAALRAGRSAPAAGEFVFVVYVKQLAVNLPAPAGGHTEERPRWQTDHQAAEIMYGMFDLAQKSGVKVLPVYAVSENPAATIIDIAATLGVDMLMLGAPHRSSMVKLLRGDIVAEVARDLPENIQLIIHS